MNKIIINIFDIKTMRKEFLEEKPKSFKDAIQQKCFDCCGYNPFECKVLNSKDYAEANREIKSCNTISCPLHEFRFGKNPYRKVQFTEEERQRRSEHMKKILDKNN